jgi:Polysaccharide lyase
VNNHGCAIWLMGVMLSISLTASAATFQETWDDNNDFSGWTFEDRCEPYNFNISADPTQAGNKAVRVENRLESCDGKSRTELHVSNMQSLGVPYGKDFWWRQRVYIPSDWPSETMPVGWLTVMQIIAGNNTLGWDHQWRWDGPGGGTFGKVRRGAWTEWVFHHKRSTGSSGVTEAWMNGTKVVNYRGKTTFADIPMAMWKFGIYASSSSAHDTYVLWFDDIQTSGEPLEPGGSPSSPSVPLPTPAGLRIAAWE